MHRIDNVLFSHAGVAKNFVDLYVPKTKHDDVDTVLDYINNLEKWRCGMMAPQSGSDRSIQM